MSEVERRLMTIDIRILTEYVRSSAAVTQRQQQQQQQQQQSMLAPSKSMPPSSSSLSASVVLHQHRHYQPILTNEKVEQTLSCYKQWSILLVLFIGPLKWRNLI